MLKLLCCLCGTIIRLYINDSVIKKEGYWIKLLELQSCCMCEGHKEACSPQAQSGLCWPTQRAFYMALSLEESRLVSDLPAEEASCRISCVFRKYLYR